MTEAAVLITKTFNAYFRNWKIELSPQDLQPGERRSLTERGWRIHYLVDVDHDGELFLEFYATHRMTNDRHILISSRGTMKHLDALTSMVFYDPKVGGEKERASRRNIEHNQKVAAALEAKALFPSGDINAFLRTGGMEGRTHSRRCRAYSERPTSRCRSCRNDCKTRCIRCADGAGQRGTWNP
jgi:hypothetical protein